MNPLYNSAPSEKDSATL
jgi:hypothetical protein